MPGCKGQPKTNMHAAKSMKAFYNNVQAPTHEMHHPVSMVSLHVWRSQLGWKYLASVEAEYIPSRYSGNLVATSESWLSITEEEPTHQKPPWAMQASATKHRTSYGGNQLTTTQVPTHEKLMRGSILTGGRKGSCARQERSSHHQLDCFHRQMHARHQVCCSPPYS